MPPTRFVQNAAFNGFGCGLGGPAGEHHEHQRGGLWAIGGLWWAVFKAVQHERPRVAEIKHQSCRYCDVRRGGGGLKGRVGGGGEGGRSASALRLPGSGRGFGWGRSVRSTSGRKQGVCCSCWAVQLRRGVQLLVGLDKVVQEGLAQSWRCSSRDKTSSQRDS